MHFGSFREMSENIGKDLEIEISFGGLPENAGCILSAVVMMTTADGKHPAFSGRHKQLFIISDIFTE